MLPQQGDASHKKKRKTNEPGQQSLQEVIENARGNEQPYQEEGHEVNPRTLSWKPNWSSYTVIRRSENSKPKPKHWSVTELSDDIVRMETGLPAKEVFKLLSFFCLQS